MKTSKKKQAKMKRDKHGNELCQNETYENGMMKFKYKDVESNKELLVDLTIAKDNDSNETKSIVSFNLMESTD